MAVPGALSRTILQCEYGLFIMAGMGNSGWL